MKVKRELNREEVWKRATFRQSKNLKTDPRQQSSQCSGAQKIQKSLHETAQLFFDLSALRPLPRKPEVK